MEVLYIPQHSGKVYEVITINDGDDRSTDCSPCSSCNVCLRNRSYYEWKHKKYCCLCFEKLYGQKCVTCNKTISGSDRLFFIYFCNRTWHKECFKCTGCGKSLENSLSAHEDKFHCANCGTGVKL